MGVKGNTLKQNVSLQALFSFFFNNFFEITSCIITSHAVVSLNNQLGTA